jgi:hypothetical protein
MTEWNSYAYWATQAWINEEPETLEKEELDEETLDDED